VLLFFERSQLLSLTLSFSAARLMEVDISTTSTTLPPSWGSPPNLPANQEYPPGDEFPRQQEGLLRLPSLE
jgi:hypothetical protein